MDLKILSLLFFVFAAGVNANEPDKCLQKYNVSEITISTDAMVAFKSDSSNLSEEVKDNINCVYGCIVNTIKEKGETMYHYFQSQLNNLDKAVEAAVDVRALRLKLNTCANVEDDDCKFMHCVDLFSEPYKSLMREVMKDIKPIKNH